MTTNNYNVLAFYDSIEKQNHRRWWVDSPWPLITSKARLVPFQLPKRRNGNDISIFEIVNYNTGVGEDILNEVLTKGLSIKTEVKVDYDLVFYPDSVDLDLERSGLFYLKLSDGADTVYSEVFCCSDVSEMIKIEYFHLEDFIYPSGHFRFEFPYKNRIYICSDIGKPSYPYNEKATKRDGITFHEQQISYKLNKFQFISPEYFIDAFRLIRQHDRVEISYKGYEYSVDEFLMEDPDWEDRSDVAVVNVEFKTDTVVVINGRAVDSVLYEAELGTCVVPSRITEAIFTEGSTEHFEQRYTPYQSTESVQLKVNDFVIVRNDSGELNLYFVNEDFEYQQFPVGSNNTIYNRNTNQYFIVNSAFKISDIYITSIAGGVVTGKAYAGSIINIIGRVGAYDDYIIGSGTAEDLSGAGIAYDLSGRTYNAIRLSASSYLCDQFGRSVWTSINDPIGIGSDEIGTDLIVY